jgi:hypothetical protein
MSACSRGSFVPISQLANDIDAEQQIEMVRRLNQSVAVKETMRDLTVTRLFAVLELVQPGVVRVAEPRPDSGFEAASPTGLWGGVARKS